MLAPRPHTAPPAPTGFASAARRHAGWLLGLPFAALAVAVVGAFLWPDVFQSSATVRYQSTADETTFEKDLNDRMQSVLSRSALKSTIERYDLYANDRKRLPLEDVIENMKRKIHFGRISRRDSTALKVATFPVSFDSSDRFQAQKVVSELAAQMIAANQRATLNTLPSAAGGVAPTTDALVAAEGMLEETEAQLAEFRDKNADHLPEQAAANQEMMSSLRIGLSKLQNQIVQTTREQSALQTSLAAEVEKRRNIKLYVDAPEPEKTENPRLTALESQIQTLEEQIKTLKVQYTENFPDVKQARQKLDKAKADRDAIVKEEAAKASPARQRADPDAARAASAADAEIKRIQSQIEAKSTEADQLSKEAAEMDRNVQAMQLKSLGSSDIEKQYATLLKERDLNKSKYDEEEIRYQAALDSASPAPKAVPQPAAASAGISALDVSEPASLPVAPIEPNRGLIIGAGGFLGILAGLVAVAVLAAQDRALRTQYGISEFDTEDARRPGGTAWIRWAAVIALGVGAMAAAVAHYYANRI